MLFFGSDGQLVPSGVSPVTSKWLGAVEYGRPLVEDMSPAEIYQKIPAVQIVLDFLARNVAQLPLHIFRRLSDSHRVRVIDHPVASFLAHPNLGINRYEFIRTIVGDLGLYGNTFWLLIRDDDGVPMAMVRLAPDKVRVEGRFWAEKFVVPTDDGVRELAAEDVVHIKNYNPDSVLYGLSPLGALSDLLVEDKEATEFRKAYWRNGAKPSFFIKRPEGVPPFNDRQREAFRQNFEAVYAGAGNAGKVPILEDGMEPVSLSGTARDQQLLESKMQTMQMVCSAYGVTPAMLGLPSSNASYASVREMHVMLYQDTLGPVMEHISGALERQLLPNFEDTDGLYLEFNFRSKLQGSPLEQAQVAQTQVGGPILTRNEARAGFDLPPVDGGDLLITPLNVVTGGLASPRDTARKSEGKAVSLAGFSMPQKQLHGVVSRWLIGHRQRIGEELGLQARRYYKTYGSLEGFHFDMSPFDVSTDFVGVVGTMDEDLVLSYGMWTNPADLAERLASKLLYAHNAEIVRAVEQAVLDDDIVVLSKFARRLTGKKHPEAFQWARLTVKQYSAAVAHAVGMRDGRVTHKKWVTSGRNSRPSHARLHGETVPVGEPFSNGAQYPGDPSLPDGETAHCQCELELIRGGL